jgi:hypothetical protein
MAPEDERDPAGADESREFREAKRRFGPLESLYQELVRRTASLGLSSFVLTEEALRKAFSESLPQDWVEYLARQGTDTRKELLEALIREFGDWLRKIDPETLQRTVLHTLLEDFELSFEIKVSAKPRGDPERSLELVRPRR